MNRWGCLFARGQTPTMPARISESGRSLLLLASPTRSAEKAGYLIEVQATAQLPPLHTLGAKNIN